MLIVARAKSLSSPGSKEIRLAVELFLAAASQPVLLDPGDDPLPITAENFVLTERGPILTIECWNETKNLVRRIRAITAERRGRLELEVEHFGNRRGTITLLDLANPANRDADRRGSRLKYRERFRRSLRRQFPEWRVVQVSTEPDLQHSLSPAFPRALLRKGTAGIAAIGASEEALAPETALSFGIIWLDYLRRREPNLTIHTLAIFLPSGFEHTTCHRVRYLDPQAANYLVFVHNGNDEAQVDPRDYCNLETRLTPAARSLVNAPPRLLEWIDRISRIDGVQRRNHPDGSASLAVNGFEFARASGNELLFGLDQKHVAGSESHIQEIERLATELARMRHADAADRTNPLYTRHPEAWLEAQVRENICRIDPMILPDPIYGQVPQLAGRDRGMIDLLAVDRDARLVVLEIKASEDIHLPLQALDYWMRVKWHLDRGEFSGAGYFQRLVLKNEAPRLLLIAPSLDFHPSNDVILRYFSPQVPVERVGVGLEWKRDLRIMFRFPSEPWLQSFTRSSKLSQP